MSDAISDIYRHDFDMSRPLAEHAVCRSCTLGKGDPDWCREHCETYRDYHRQREAAWRHPRFVADETDGVKGGSIYAQALERWGRATQTLQAIEECSELVTALLHSMRGRGDAGAVAEEIADVQIMCEQMALVFGPGLVAEKKREKLARLAGLLGRDGA